jgi:cytochrome c553
MEFSRLVLFVFFLLLTAGALSLQSYKRYYGDDKSLDISQLKKVEKTAAKEEVQEEAPVEEVLEPKAVVLDTNQLKNAHDIYTGVGECIRCHGEFGQGNPAEEAPLIAGQHEWYIYDQLIRMKKGERVNEKMNPYLKKLGDQDFKDLAAYISKLRAGKRAE